MTINTQRRNLMKALPAAAGLSLGVPARAATAPDPWLQAQAIIDRVSKPLTFRKQDFTITAYGARTCKMAKVKAWISFEEQDTVDTPAAGSHDCYAAFKAAIAACHNAGGGRVLVPAGNWYCAGPIVLRSNVNLHLSAGAHIYFSNNPADYAKYGDIDCGKQGKLTISRWQSNDCLNFSSMIYAYGQDNIALTGDDWTSTLNGQGGVPFNDQGDCWWTWKGKLKTLNAVAQGSTPNFTKGKMSENTENLMNAESLSTIAPQLTEAERLLIQGEGARWRADAQYLPALSEAGVPLSRRVFGLGHYLRPPMIQLIGCTNVLLQGYHVTHTPFWQHHPVHCRNIVIRKVHCESLGPNSDGFDPEACDHVLIDGCTFDTGDDCIAIKAGKDLDTQYGPSQNIVIQNCTMQSGHGAVTLGSEMAGGIQNVYAQKLVFQNINWATNPLNTAIRLKTNLNRGGYLRNFYVRDISIPNGVQTSPSFYASLPGSPIQSKTVATAAGAIVTFDCDYTPISDNVRTRPPVVSNVHISNVKVGDVKTKDGKMVSCYQAIVILGPVASDYNGPLPMPAVVPVTGVTIADCDFGTPANLEQPWYLYNVQGLKLDNVTIGGKVHNTTLSA
ncbi:glycoside hydrolase family 28 protein [Duganella sp. BJB1802]|uniref:glycoside hydrolase family 28 protein n=1 Tax=Duganella sp. BJB1802 TaxID=2744575 RepID=UPI001593553A|nr:glycoside hydrolase family 28 protein [Duganella sp. BJB1802]NVD70199.1 glycoside hydrolase family 28 protein [Duganella sp. BJB1802]